MKKSALFGFTAASFSLTVLLSGMSANAVTLVSLSLFETPDVSSPIPSCPTFLCTPSDVAILNSSLLPPIIPIQNTSDFVVTGLTYTILSDAQFSPENYSSDVFRSFTVTNDGKLAHLSGGTWNIGEVVSGRLQPLTPTPDGVTYSVSFSGEAVPEPSTIAGVALAFGVLGTARMRKRQKAANPITDSKV